MSDIVERLLTEREIPFHGGGSISVEGHGTCYGGKVTQLTNPDGREAATEITRLREQVAALEAQSLAWQEMESRLLNDITALEAREARLRANISHCQGRFLNYHCGPRRRLLLPLRRFQEQLA